MPSPFPGMDPWLEDPVVWPNLHHLLISKANAQLKPQLRPRGYLVAIGERVWVTQPGRAVYPDVFLVERPPAGSVREGGTAVLEADQPVRVKVPGAEVREPYLEILDAHDERVVTCIEFLSPANKDAGASRDLYVRKQRELLLSPANLVEVDLLRSGRHTVAVGSHLIDPARNWDYLVSIARAAQADEYEYYPIPLQSPLPRIRIPLKPDDADGVLDLQRVLDEAYDDGPFADRIDYSQPPFGKLAADKLAWCREVLAAKHTSPKN